MATKTLEARLENLSVKDENEAGHSHASYGKHKVIETQATVCLPTKSFLGLPLRPRAYRPVEQ
jgi:hypothetical protein